MLMADQNSCTIPASLSDRCPSSPRGTRASVPRRWFPEDAVGGPRGDLADSALVGAGQRWWAMIEVVIQLFIDPTITTPSMKTRRSRL